MAAPGGISNLQHTFTTSSLDVTWDTLAGADGYIASLSRDGAEVASQDVAVASASFTGLEDGTLYTLSLYAYNADGSGPIASYQATTAYVIPAVPTNLRQFEERIIAVICRWDLAEPSKVLDVEAQLLYGGELVGSVALGQGVEEHTFIVPMASTDYLLRVRAGNPAGWSDWAEATVHSETFPLIDSRLGVMGATYQEDVLHTDTWGGASDQLKGVVEQLSADAEVTIDNYAFETTFKPAKEGDSTELSGFNPILSVTITERPAIWEFSPSEAGGFSPVVQVAASERILLITHNLSERAGFGELALSVTSTEALKAFQHTLSEAAGFAPVITVSASETL